MNKTVTQIAEELSAPFPADQVHWRIGRKVKDGKKAMVLAYLDARDVQDRLDAVCGIDGWNVSYEEQPSGILIGTIGIRLDSEDQHESSLFNHDWIYKSDGAGDTAVEAEKGKISDALKRTAVAWGIGRYLYRLGTTYVTLKDDYGNFDPPTLPAWALPSTKVKPITVEDVSINIHRIREAFKDVGQERIVAWAKYFNVGMDGNICNLSSIPEDKLRDANAMLETVYNKLSKGE